MHDPFVGPWSLNPARSELTPNHRPSEATMTWQIEGKQQIGIACGGSFILARSGMPSTPGGTLFVFELP